MGILSKLIGIVFMIIGGVIIFTLGSSGDFLWLLLGMFVLSIGFSFMAGGRKPVEHKPPPPTVTEIRCDSTECKFVEIRNFENGDYILKKLDAKCPKCERPMTIQGVYVVHEEPESELENI